MPRDGRSPSGRFLPTRASILEIGLLVNASFLLAGCASTAIIPGGFQDRANHRSESSTVRSQNESLSAGKDSSAVSHSAAADYGPLQSRFEDRPPEGLKRSESSLTAPGHSFLVPKVKLGRPIPLPDTDDRAEVDSRSPGLLDESPATGQILETAQGDSQEASGRTPWPTDPGMAWKPVAKGDPTWRQLDESYSPAADENPASETKAIDPKATPLINEIPESTEDNPNPAANGVSPGLNPESAPMQEPSMLDRFRGLYAPRLEDNTDRLRKQIRRWPDPFGLLKDRDETVNSGAVTTPIQTLEQETSSVELPLSAEQSSSVPVNPVSPLATVIADLETELSNWPGLSSGKPERLDEWRQRQTDLRLLYMVAGRTAESMRVIESLPEEEQEFWQSMMLSMNQYRSVGNRSDRAEQLSETLSHLRTASRKLQPLCTLEMRHLMLCDRIDGFGQVSAFPTADFNPGQRVLIYTEVLNFRSELTSEGTWRSEFAAIIEFMRQGDEEVVETIRIPQILDACNTQRSDFFHSFEITLPALAGQYELRIRLRDQLSLQTTESQLTFNIRSQNSGL